MLQGFAGGGAVLSVVGAAAFCSQGCGQNQALGCGVLRQEAKGVGGFGGLLGGCGDCIGKEGFPHLLHLGQCLGQPLAGANDHGILEHKLL